MSTEAAWQIKGIYFEACNCDSVCPCYSAHPPTYGYCEGSCAWHITQGKFGDVELDGLNVIMMQRCDGFMRETLWDCWWYLDDRATDAQFDALKNIFTLQVGGHLAKTFGKLWVHRGVERARIEMKLDGWQHHTSVFGKLGLAVGLLKTEAGPTLCRLPNVPGVAALADEDWFDDGNIKFDYKNQNALSSTFTYQNDL